MSAFKSVKEAIERTIWLHEESIRTGSDFLETKMVNLLPDQLSLCPLCDVSPNCISCPWFTYEGKMCSNYNNNEASIKRLNTWLILIENSKLNTYD